MNITNCPKRGREHIVSVSFQRSKFRRVCKILKLIKKNMRIQYWVVGSHRYVLQTCKMDTSIWERTVENFSLTKGSKQNGIKL